MMMMMIIRSYRPIVISDDRLLPQRNSVLRAVERVIISLVLIYKHGPSGYRRL